MKKSLLPLLIGILALTFTASVPAIAQEPSVAEEKQSSPWETMFPDGLIKAGQKAKAANQANVKSLKGKFVGIYNSASWCGPCRMFTPQLVKFHKKNKANIEIVFNSADKTEDDMINYAKKDKMKWLALPFGKQPNFRSSSGGIPCLTIFSPDGKQFKTIMGSSRENPDPRLEELAKEIKAWKEANKTASK